MVPSATNAAKRQPRLSEPLQSSHCSRPSQIGSAMLKRTQRDRPSVCLVLVVALLTGCETEMSMPPPPGEATGGGEAVLLPPQFTLSVTTTGEGSVTRPEGSGTVEVDVEVFDKGAEVTLTATPADGWWFQQWQGDSTGTQSSTTITMDDDMDITAVFVACECPPVWTSKTVVLNSPDTDTQVVEGSGVLHRIWIADQEYGFGSDFDLTIRDANGVLILLTSVGQGPDLDVRFEGKIRITKTTFPEGGRANV